VWLLLALVCAPLFLQLDHTFWGSETRWTFVSQTMLDTHAWFDPQLGWRFYGDKPLLSYWLIVLAALPTGHVDEVASRLPSVLAGIATVWITAWLAARLFGRGAALWAGLLLATSYGFFSWARVASADLLNLLFTTAAVAVYAESILAWRRWQIPVFFVLLAVGGHAKGTPAILVPLAVAGVDVLVARRRELLRHAGWIALWAGVFVVLYALPFVASWLERGDWGLFELMWRENFTRATDAYDHVEPAWYYLGILPLFFLPWSAFLPTALVGGVRGARLDRGVRFAGIACVVILALFSASESRRTYYILPILPFLALLLAGVVRQALAAARGGADALGRAAWVGAGWIRVPTALTGVALLAAAAALAGGGLVSESLGAVVQALPAAPWIALAVGALGAGAIAAAWLGRLEAGLRVLGAAAFAIVLVFCTSVQTLRDSLKVEKRFAAQIRREHPGERLAFFHGAVGPLRYYAGGDDVAGQPGEIVKMLEHSGDSILVVCDWSSCERWLPEENRLGCLPRGESISPGLGAWFPPEREYGLYLCVRK
jgi:4-amino-4-deoxy-L-arabinose transferase-like glycosyltransferase